MYALEFENESMDEYQKNSNAYVTAIDRIKIKRTHELYNQFTQRPDAHWTFTAISLPQNLLGPYRLRFVTNSGPLHVPSYNKPYSIRIANLSLSKECFSKGG